jgi:NitT/TauT family transport system substrate-binding protein
MERVVIGLPIPQKLTAAYAYFGTAVALGYDRAEGLGFELVYADDPGTAAGALGAGRCDFAPLNTTMGLLSRERGLAMKAVYSKSRRAHRWFAVVPESPIVSLADLRGKRIACDFADLQPEAEAALTEEGVAPGQITWVPWRGSGMETRQMIGPLSTGEVDAVFLIDWNHGDFIAEGLRLRRLPSTALDRITLSSCLWVASPAVQGNAEMIGGVGRALAKTIRFALTNPAAAISLMWESHPETRPAGAERARALRRDVEIVRARLDTLDPTGSRDPRWGVIERHEIVAWQDFLLGAGALSRRLEPEVYYTNAHVDHFNAFDEQQVIEHARRQRVET